MERINLVKNQLKNVWVYKNIEPLDLEFKTNLKGKTLFVTGASRGIGLAIALRAARDGANVALVAKTVTQHKTLEGTIYTAAEEIRKAGGNALPIQCDIRDDASVQNAVELTVKTFGGIDILINNASAISLVGTEQLDMKRFDLMQNINTRGTFMCTKYCIKYLKQSSNPHVLNISPPLKEITDPKWFKDHTGYSIAKFGMSLCVLGMSAEFKDDGVGVNALWPRTSIATAAVNHLLGGEVVVRASRTPEIMADAAYLILTSNSKKTTGNFFIDDEVIVSSGVEDLSKYNVDKNIKPWELVPDFFV